MFGTVTNNQMNKSLSLIVAKYSPALGNSMTTQIPPRTHLRAYEIAKIVGVRTNFVLEVADSLGLRVKSCATSYPESVARELMYQTRLRKVLVLAGISDKSDLL